MVVSTTRCRFSPLTILQEARSWGFPLRIIPVDNAQTPNSRSSEMPPERDDLVLLLHNGQVSQYR